MLERILPFLGMVEEQTNPAGSKGADLEPLRRVTRDEGLCDIVKKIQSGSWLAGVPAVLTVIVERHLYRDAYATLHCNTPTGHSRSILSILERCYHALRWKDPLRL